MELEEVMKLLNKEKITKKDIDAVKEYISNQDKVLEALKKNVQELTDILNGTLDNLRIIQSAMNNQNRLLRPLLEQATKGGM